MVIQTITVYFKSVYHLRGLKEIGTWLSKHIYSFLHKITCEKFSPLVINQTCKIKHQLHQTNMSQQPTKFQQNELKTFHIYWNRTFFFNFLPVLWPFEGQGHLDKNQNQVQKYLSLYCIWTKSSDKQPTACQRWSSSLGQEINSSHYP